MFDQAPHVAGTGKISRGVSWPRGAGVWFGFRPLRVPPRREFALWERMKPNRHYRTLKWHAFCYQQLRKPITGDMGLSKPRIAPKTQPVVCHPHRSGRPRPAARRRPVRFPRRPLARPHARAHRAWAGTGVITMPTSLRAVPSSVLWICWGSSVDARRLLPATAGLSRGPRPWQSDGDVAHGTLCRTVHPEGIRSPTPRPVWLYARPGAPPRRSQARQSHIPDSASAPGSPASSSVGPRRGSGRTACSAA